MTTFITFRGVADVAVEYHDHGYEPDTNAREIAWWFTDDDMQGVEVTPEEEEAIRQQCQRHSQDREMYGEF